MPLSKIDFKNGLKLRIQNFINNVDSIYTIILIFLVSPFSCRGDDNSFISMWLLKYYIKIQEAVKVPKDQCCGLLLRERWPCVGCNDSIKCVLKIASSSGSRAHWCHVQVDVCPMLPLIDFFSSSLSPCCVAVTSCIPLKLWLLEFPPCSAKRRSSPK